MVVIEKMTEWFNILFQINKIFFNCRNVFLLYFSCIIVDATACCSQEIEFVLSGEHAYPDDYPEEGSEIVVQGIFNTYEENGYMYCQLKDAVME